MKNQSFTLLLCLFSLQNYTDFLFVQLFFENFSFVLQPFNLLHIAKAAIMRFELKNKHLCIFDK